MAIYGHIRLKLMMSSCFFICLGVYADLLCHNWSKLCQKCQFRPLDPEYLIWYLNIVPGDFYYKLWSYIIEIDMSACDLTCSRGLWRSSGGKFGQKYVKNTYFVTPWIPNIQYDASILCQDILNYYLWLYNDQDWYASMSFDLFQGLWRSPRTKIC